MRFFNGLISCLFTITILLMRLAGSAVYERIWQLNQILKFLTINSNKKNTTHFTFAEFHVKSEIASLTFEIGSE